MMNNKKGEWIAMDCCPICNKDISIVIDQTMKGKFKDKQVITSFYLCDDCIKKFTEENRIIIYEAEGFDKDGKPNITGQYINLDFKALNIERFNEKQKEFIIKNRIAFCDKEIFEIIKKRIENANK